ncbi:MAG: DUF3179 domain-containing (seleno)protein, partial [Planctomycetota bacterium]
DRQRTFVAYEAAESAFMPAGDVTLMEPDELVVVLSIGGEARAYPVKTLRTIAGVVDKFGETPVFVCYSWVSQTARCLGAQVAGHQVLWRDTGLVYRGHRVYYDPETGSLWDSFSGRALTGPSVGQAADVVPVAVWPWEQWAGEHADSAVMVANLKTVAQRAPQLDRALSVYLQDELPPFELVHYQPQESPLSAKAFVLGVALDGRARAYPLGPMYRSDLTSVTDSLAGRTIEVRVTSSRTGHATAEGEVLDAPTGVWFAWKECHPQSDLYEVPAETPQATTPADTAVYPGP